MEPKPIHLPDQNVKEDQIPINWPALFQSLFQARWLIITVISLVCLWSVLYAYGLPDVYTSSAKVRVLMLENTPMEEYKEMIRADMGTREVYYSTQMELMQGAPILEKVVRILNLMEFYDTTIERAVERLKGTLEIYLIPKTEIVVLNITTTDPKISAEAVNTIAETYIDVSSSDQAQVPDQIKKWFPNDGQILTDRDSLNRFREMSDEERMAALPTLTQDPQLKELRDQLLVIENDLAQLMTRYTPNHPTVKELEVKADFVRKEINLQRERLIRILKSALSGDFNVKRAVLVEKARPSNSPSGPNRNKIIITNTFLAAFGVLSLVLFLHFVNRKVHRAEDLKEIANIPFLGYVPSIRRTRKKTQNTHYNIIQEVGTNDVLSNAIHDVRNNLLFSMPQGKSKIILFTSFQPNDGKSTVSAMLSISMAEMGEKVLIIDADMRKPTVDRTFNLENRGGLSNCLSADMNWKDLVCQLEDYPNLHFLTAGHRAPNSTALLSSNKMMLLLEDLRQNFDRIIIDVPPALHIPDSFIIGEKADGLVLVVRSGGVHFNMVRQLKEKIDSLSLNLVGVIINRVNFSNLYYPFADYFESYSKYNYFKKE